MQSHIKTITLLTTFCLSISFPNALMAIEYRSIEANSSPTLEDAMALAKALGLEGELVISKCSEQFQGENELGNSRFADVRKLDCKKGESDLFYYKCKENCDNQKGCEWKRYRVADGWITLWSKCSCP